MNFENRSLIGEDMNKSSATFFWPTLNMDVTLAGTWPGSYELRADLLGRVDEGQCPRLASGTNLLSLRPSDRLPQKGLLCRQRRRGLRK